MYIKSGKRGILEITSESATAALISGEVKPEDLTEFTVVMGSVQAPGVISFPGEYEYSDLSIVALESASEHDGVADMFRITSDKVEILFLSAVPAEVEKDEFELLGNIDIVLLGAAAIHEDVVQFVKKIDPYIVVAVAGDNKADVEKALGMEAVQTEKKYKFVDKDFTSEEPTTALYLLQA